MAIYAAMVYLFLAWLSPANAFIRFSFVLLLQKSTAMIHTPLSFYIEYVPWQLFYTWYPTLLRPGCPYWKPISLLATR